ncbi:MAG TPA: hypothetical protein VHT53_08200 [Candidatus Elarobacter sp.]|jgi:hypothetical protein|nr:hypothetical protein [Candidatus Elarobacter sp.]
MMLLPACGRQVTGLDLPNGAIVPIGQTLIRFETAGPLDFQNVSYLIVFNTSGNGQQPYAQGYNSDFKNWSAYFLVGGGSTYANFPGLEQVYQNPANGSSQSFNVVIPVGTVNFQTSIPSANAAYGFQITFNRCLLDLAPPTSSQPPPPNVNRVCPLYNNIGTIWNVSLFTLDRTLSPIDSLGTNGPNDTSYVFSFDTAQTFTTNHFKPQSGSTVSNPSAQITGIEVFSTAPVGAVSAPSPTPSPAPTP